MAQMTPELTQYIEQMTIVRTRLELALVAKEEEVNRLKKELESLKSTPSLTQE